MNNRRLHIFLILITISVFVVGNTSFAQKTKEKVKINFFGDTIKKKIDMNTFKSGLSPEQEICRIIGLNYPIPEINYSPDSSPKFWTIGVLDELGFSQVSLTNWAAGGEGSIAFNAYVNAMANYEKGKMYWENRAQLAYGFVQSFDIGYRKADDKIILDSKWGYRAYKKLYFSAAFNFKSQFSPGFDYDSKGKATMKSKFLAPGYASFGLGIDYKPGDGKVLSVSLSPLTAGVTIVKADSLLRVRYGNRFDRTFRWELGAQFKVTFQKDLFKNFKVGSQFSLFADYLGNVDNVVIFWDVQMDYIINKYFKASFRTNLIYDDKIKIVSKSGREAPRVQFKEVFGLNFSYTIGNFKK